MIACLFPGQGSQSIGMLDDFKQYESCKLVVEEIENTVNVPISHIIENGPMDKLTQTENAQLAIFTVGAVGWNILQNECNFNACQYLAGHSLGEYTALYASKSISLKDASSLVLKRGKLMSECQNDNCCMMALLGISAEDVLPFINSNDCVLANNNSSTQVVLSGYTVAIDQVVNEIKNKFPLIKVIKLNTSGAFHSPLMAQAAIKLSSYISGNIMEFHKPQIPILSNVTGIPITDINLELVKQMVCTVQWKKSIDFLINQGVDTFIEMPPGKVLTNMLKREYPQITVFTFKEFLDTLK